MSFADSEMSFTVSEMSLAVLTEMSFGQNAQKKGLIIIMGNIYRAHTFDISMHGSYFHTWKFRFILEIICQSPQFIFQLEMATNADVGRGNERFAENRQQVEANDGSGSKHID